MKDSTVPFPNLPDDVIIEILTWLPVKPLLKFKCVCKSWRTLISSKRFVRAHLQNSKSDQNFTSHRLIMESRGNLKQCSVDSVLYEPISEASDLSCPFQTERVRVVGSCNGLVCLSMDRKELILWNPSTRIWKKLPDLSLIPEVGDYVNYGFGFDRSSDDYKLVVHSYGNPDLTGGIMQVYSLKNDEWKRIKYFVNDHLRMHIRATFVNGKLYWIAYRLYVSENLCQIVSFDLEKEEGEILQLPSFLRSCKFASLGEFEESLLVLCGQLTSEDVWMMDGCSVGDEKWTKVVTMPYTNDDVDYTSYKRALYVKNGRVLFLSLLNRKYAFMKFDANDSSISYPEVSHLQSFLTDEWFQVGTYLESLVSPLG